MARGFTANPDDLRSGARQIRGAAHPLLGIHVKTAEMITAVPANPGYATSQALTGFVTAVRHAARRAKDRVDEHADALEGCATNYDTNEEQAASQFRSFLGN